MQLTLGVCSSLRQCTQSHYGYIESYPKMGFSFSGFRLDAVPTFGLTALACGYLGSDRSLATSYISANPFLWTKYREGRIMPEATVGSTSPQFIQPRRNSMRLKLIICSIAGIHIQKLCHYKNIAKEGTAAVLTRLIPEYKGDQWFSQRQTCRKSQCLFRVQTPTPIIKPPVLCRKFSCG